MSDELLKISVWICPACNSRSVGLHMIPMTGANKKTLLDHDKRVLYEGDIHCERCKIQEPFYSQFSDYVPAKWVRKFIEIRHEA